MVELTKLILVGIRMPFGRTIEQRRQKSGSHKANY